MLTVSEKMARTVCCTIQLPCRWQSSFPQAVSIPSSTKCGLLHSDKLPLFCSVQVIIPTLGPSAMLDDTVHNLVAIAKMEEGDIYDKANSKVSINS